LAKQKPQLEKSGAGATNAEVKGKIIEYSWWLKKNAYAESTIFQYTKMINLLVRRGANLFDGESVKDVIARQDWNVNRKGNMTWVYVAFAKMCGIPFERPKYKRVDKLPFVPTEGEVDQLIAGCGKKVATYLQLLKETGMRAGEAWQLLWTEVDNENNTVRVTPEKNSNPRMLRVSRKLIAMLNNLPKASNRVFGDSCFKSHYMNFRKQRKKIASKLENPRILHITFKTLRHFKATMEYHKTKDILHVMQVLGHKNIQNTLIYTHLMNFKDDEFTSKVAKTLKEACELVEAGFEYITEMDGAKIFRKRK